MSFSCGPKWRSGRSIPFTLWSTDREACCGWALGALLFGALIPRRLRSFIIAYRRTRQTITLVLGIPVLIGAVLAIWMAIQNSR